MLGHPASKKMGIPGDPEGKHFLKACSHPQAKGVQPKHGGDLSVDRGDQFQSRPNYAWLDFHSSCTHHQPGKGPPVCAPLAGLGHQTWARTVHEVLLGWQEPSKSNTQHHRWWGSLLCKQPQTLPELEVLGAPGMQCPQDCRKSITGRGWGHHSLCLEKVLLRWVTPPNSTFFRGFIASFQRDCAGECVQKQMDPLSVSLLHIISYSLGAIKLPGRTNLQACAVPYF